MHRKELLDLLEKFRLSSYCTQEEALVANRFTRFVKTEPLCFERHPNPCHITGSALVLSDDLSRVLLMHHRKIGRWLQFGGHADGDSNVKRVALREATEESGMPDLQFVCEDPVDIDIHDLPSGMSCQTHFDLRFLLRAPKNGQFVANNESNALVWYALEEALALVLDDATKRLLQKAIASNS